MADLNTQQVFSLRLGTRQNTDERFSLPEIYNINQEDKADACKVKQVLTKQSIIKCYFV